MSEQGQDPKKRKGAQIKVPEEVARGTYANAMAVFHTREEFVLDFVLSLPPQGIINSRVLISPGHLKRVIGALQGNLTAWEEKFGPVPEPPEPTGRPPEEVH